MANNINQVIQIFVSDLANLLMFINKSNFCHNEFYILVQYNNSDSFVPFYKLSHNLVDALIAAKTGEKNNMEIILPEPLKPNDLLDLVITTFNKYHPDLKLFPDPVFGTNYFILNFVPQ